MVDLTEVRDSVIGGEVDDVVEMVR